MEIRPENPWGFWKMSEKGEADKRIGPDASALRSAIDFPLSIITSDLRAWRRASIGPLRVGEAFLFNYDQYSWYYVA